MISDYLSNMHFGKMKLFILVPDLEKALRQHFIHFDSSKLWTKDSFHKPFFVEPVDPMEAKPLS